MPTSRAPSESDDIAILARIAETEVVQVMIDLSLSPLQKGKTKLSGRGGRCSGKTRKQMDTLIPITTLHHTLFICVAVLVNILAEERVNGYVTT